MAYNTLTKTFLKSQWEEWIEKILPQQMPLKTWITSGAMSVLTVSETSNPSKGCDGHMWHVPIHTDGWAQKSYAHRVPQRYLYADHPSHLTQS